MVKYFPEHLFFTASSAELTDDAFECRCSDYFRKGKLAFDPSAHRTIALKKHIYLHQLPEFSRKQFEARDSFEICKTKKGTVRN